MPQIPTTVEEAIRSFHERIKASLDIRIAELGETPDSFISKHHFTALMAMRNEWKMWDTTGALNRDFQKTYGLCHGDDLCGVIVKGALALYNNRDYKAEIAAEVERYKAHWTSKKIDPLTMQKLADK